ncbi:MAG: non-heme ferritin [Chlorobiales bacterium]|jgi:ferritin|nr:non-heme ferritin [Chlorobiales bacterium]
MLSKTILSKLNKQINLEYYSANLYLQMSAWCIAQGLEGTGEFLRVHAEEEKGHMYRLFDYVNETGAMAILGSVAAPPTDYKTILDLLKSIYEHELAVTKEINTLVGSALEEKDFATFNFLQWYVSEQHEEEHLFHSILEKATMIGTEGRGLFLLDKEIKKLGQVGKA